MIFCTDVGRHHFILNTCLVNWNVLIVTFNHFTNILDIWDFFKTKLSEVINRQTLKLHRGCI